MRSALIGVLVLAAACSHTGAAPQARPSSSPTATAGPVALTTLAPEQVSDAGLPSTIGPGPLKAADVSRLLQYFEDHVAQAYAKGDSDALFHYLAGPMLTGNRATIAALAAQHQRNVFRITVGAATLDTADANRVIAEVTPDETLDYFVDTSTQKVLNGGLPGPSHPSLTVFLDYDPTNRTWYWTGQKST